MADTQNNFTFQSSEATNAGSLGFIIPESVIRQNLLAQNSEAWNCFTQQQFSAKLQAYMINYVISVSSYYPLYA